MGGDQSVQDSCNVTHLKHRARGIAACEAEHKRKVLVRDAEGLLGFVQRQHTVHIRVPCEDHESRCPQRDRNTRQGHLSLKQLVPK